MKQEKMLKYMNLLDDKYIIEAAPKSAIPVQKKKSIRLSNRLLRYSALVASLAFVIGIGLLIPHLRNDAPLTPPDSEQDNPGIILPHDTPVAPDTYTNPDTHKADVGTDPSIGGEHMGDELISPYLGCVDGVVYQEGTFSEKYYLYMEDFDKEEGRWEYNRPAVLYYLAQKMNLTRADLETYYTSLDFKNIPENVYRGLLADTLEESMQLLKTEYAFYSDGKLYTVYDIYELSRPQAEVEVGVPFDVTDEEYDRVWQNIDEYLDSPCAYDVGDGIRNFVDEMVKNIYVDKE